MSDTGESSHTVTQQAARREAVILTLVALGYSNGLAILAMRRNRVADQAYRWTNPVFLVALLITLARVRRTSVPRLLREAGVQRAGWPVALGGGLVLGGVLAAPALVFFARPLVLDSPLEYGPIGGLSRRAFWLRVLIELPLGVALFEELLFRGLLWEAWARAASQPVAWAASSAVFAWWHCAVGVDTMRRTNIGVAATRLPRPLRRHANMLGVLGGMLSTGVAGMLLGWLRTRGRGNLLGPALAHWIADALIVAALRRGR
jgi:membrane protease YdiL (CAAX protease family)